MKFKCKQKELVAVLSVAQSVKLNKAGSVLSDVLIIADGGALSVTACDGVMFYRDMVDAEIEEEGSCVINCNKLYEVISSLPEGDVSLSTGDGELLISATGKKVKFKLKMFGADKFPEMPVYDSMDLRELPSGEFVKMVKFVKNQVSTDSARYILTGIYITRSDEGALLMVTTDGRRLSYAEAGVDTHIETDSDFKSVIVPVKALEISSNKMKDTDSLEIGFTDNLIVLCVNEKTAFTSTIIDATYPDYKKVIPENSNVQFTVNRVDLINALKRSELLSDNKIKKVVINLHEGELQCNSIENEKGSCDETLECDYKGDDVSFGMNVSYFKQALECMDSEECIITACINGDTSVLRPIKIMETDKENRFQVVMPMTL